MFYKAYAFNQDIGDWDVSNVTNMEYMFHKAYAFNQDIGDWDVSNVTNMEYMFMNARAFSSGYGEGWIENNIIPKESLFWKMNRCNNSQACNYMSNTEGSCYYEGREDCSGNPLYCTDPTACNYNEIGDCSYHGSREDCYGNPLYCTYVKIQKTDKNFLTLMEVEVFDLNGTNVALNGTATQSSDMYDYGGYADRAINGNTDQDYETEENGTHTQDEQNAWWQVELAEPTIIESIKIYNRSDCCSDRLNNTNIILLDSTQTEINVQSWVNNGDLIQTFTYN